MMSEEGVLPVPVGVACLGDLGGLRKGGGNGRAVGRSCSSGG